MFRQPVYYLIILTQRAGGNVAPDKPVNVYCYQFYVIAHSLWSFLIGTEKNAKSLCTCHVPEAILICSWKGNTSSTVATIGAIIWACCGLQSFSKIHLVCTVVTLVNQMELWYGPLSLAFLRSFTAALISTIPLHHHLQMQYFWIHHLSQDWQGDGYRRDLRVGVQFQKILCHLLTMIAHLVWMRRIQDGGYSNSHLHQSQFYIQGLGRWPLAGSTDQLDLLRTRLWPGYCLLLGSGMSPL